MAQAMTLWHGAKVATCDPAMRQLSAAAIVTQGERIAWVGAEDALPASLRAQVTHSHDLRGAWVTPALIDCHTHLVFAGTRAAEYGDRLRGVTYEAIARRGGGILTTVRATRAASEQQLFDESAPRLAALLAEGVSTVEIKSGYGLTRVDEAKMLSVARRLAAQFPVRIRTTYLAAHALPPEYAGRADEYIDAVAQQWLPELHAAGLIDAVDVYCDSIAFTAAQAERVLSAAAALQLPVKVHAEQLANIGASRLAARYGALSADHLEHAGSAEAEALARAGTVAVLLPVAFYCLSSTRLPPIAELRAAGAAIALASDCNPGSAPGTSLLLALNMGQRLFGLTPEEALAGVTRHAARALGLQNDVGQIAPGYLAELAVWDIETPEELGYWIGYNRCRAVIRGGALHSAAAAPGPWSAPSK